jgi:hypothetical protein
MPTLDEDGSIMPMSAMAASSVLRFGSVRSMEPLVSMMMTISVGTFVSAYTNTGANNDRKRKTPGKNHIRLGIFLSLG